MIPERPPDFHGSDGERRVFAALKALPDEYTVIHSFRWVHPHSKHIVLKDLPAQGEGDFVLLHPQKGILVVEVKGGKVWCERGQWYQENRRTHETKQVF